MNVSAHAKKRYCERIKDMKDENEIKRYIVQNDEQIIEYILKLYKYSTFVWKGQLGDNITRHYYIKDDIVIITDTQNSAIITLYKANYGFDGNLSKLNLTIAKDLLAEIVISYEQLNQIDTKIGEEVEVKTLELETVILQKKALMEQLEILNKKEKSIQSDIETIKGEKTFKSKEIEVNVIRLVNSIEYRNDIKELTKKIV